METPSSSHTSRSKYSKFPYFHRVEKPWGYEVIFTPPELPYVGKILSIKGGKETSFQYHDEKLESWYLLSGKVLMEREDSLGKIHESEMQPGVGYTNYEGQKHRLIARHDSEILEVSTPEVGTTVRLEDEYGRPNETERLRSQPNRGWDDE